MRRRRRRRATSDRVPGGSSELLRLRSTERPSEEAAMGSRAFAGAGPQGIQAQGPRAAGREPEEDEAQENRWLALVLDRPEAAREVADEVGECHLSRGQEGR